MKLDADVLQGHLRRLHADGPQVELVDTDKVAAALPYYESNKITDEDWRTRIALRQRQIANRMLG